VKTQNAPKREFQELLPEASLRQHRTNAMRIVQALTAEEMLDGRLRMVNMGCSSTFHIHHPQSAIKHSLAL